MSPCVVTPTLALCFPGPIVEWSRTTDRTRWCFKCRAHLTHDLVLIGEAPEAMSYYGPNPRYDCSRCHQDHTRFPGTVWEWEE